MSIGTTPQSVNTCFIDKGRNPQLSSATIATSSKTNFQNQGKKPALAPTGTEAGLPKLLVQFPFCTTTLSAELCTPLIFALLESRVMPICHSTCPAVSVRLRFS